jgi:hypothetical protein
MKSALMFSRQTDEWRTPQSFFDALHVEFNFQWDAAERPYVAEDVESAVA